MCVSPAALLSALILRMKRDGYRATEGDLRALLGAGCRRASIEKALAEHEGQAFAEARSLLDRVAAPTI